MQVPNYYTIVMHPMDLTTIKRRLADNYFRQLEEFIAHCLLIFHNCALFNLVSYSIHQPYGLKSSNYSLFLICSLNVLHVN
jgi:hypothetical protein